MPHRVCPLTICSLQIQILAIGFLLVILSSALFESYLTLLVVATYVIAPLPNWICAKAQQQDDFMDNGSNSIIELGRFITGFLVVMGIGEYNRHAGSRVTRFQHMKRIGADLIMQLYLSCWHIAIRSRFQQ